VTAGTTHLVQTLYAASGVPEPVVAAVARQLGIDDLEVLAGYRDMPVRWCAGGAADAGAAVRAGPASAGQEVSTTAGGMREFLVRVSELAD